MAAEPVNPDVVVTVAEETNRPPEAAVAAAEPCAQPTHTADCHDTYVSIAATRLGDGDRYREIVDLNCGRTMPDGTVLSGDEFLEPGWELLLPDDAVPDRTAETVSEAAAGAEAAVDGAHETVTADTATDSGDTSVPHAVHNRSDDHGSIPEIGEGADGTDTAAPSVDNESMETAEEAPTPDTSFPDSEKHQTATDDQGSPETAEESTTTTPQPAHTPEPPGGPATPQADSAVPDQPSSETGDHDTDSAEDDEPAPAPTTPAETTTAQPRTATAENQKTDTEQIELTAQEDDDTDETPLAAGTIATGAMLASGILALLGTRRLLQHRARRPGHRIAQPDTESTIHAEEDLRHHADPASVELLDQALRSLAATAETEHLPPPPLLGARVTATGCELLLADHANPAHEAIPPFRALGRYSWALDPGDDALLPTEQAATTAAPYPGLLTLGQDPTGAHLLVNLTHIGAITLTGTDDHIQQVQWALAVELATSQWADHVNTTLVGVDPDLPALLDTERLRTADDIDTWLDGIEAMAGDLATTYPTEAGTPEILLTTRPLSPGHLRRLRAATLAAPTDLPVAIIAAATDTHHFPTEWTLDATPEKRVTLPELGRAITLQRATPDDQAHLTALLATTHEPDEPDPEWDLVPAEPTGPPPPHTDPGSAADSADTIRDGEVSTPPSPAPHPPPAGGGPDTDQPHRPLPPIPPLRLRDPGAPFIRVLGTVDIAGLDTAQLEAGKRRALVELACLLALKPGQTPDDVARTMGGPRGPWSASTRSANLSRLRTWLGRTPEGDPYFPTMTNGRYQLSPALGCDWTDFHRLSHRGLAHDTPEGTHFLLQALDLVRGEPFSGAAPGRYAWAEPLKHTINAAVADTTHTIAVRALASGDLAPAREALIKILEIDPVNELLYRDLIRLEHQAGNPKAIDRAVQRLTIALDTLDLDMEPATIELINQVTANR
ncbi:hypothetical protein ABH917_000868 [Thermobifida halotolerans]|uniref:BTAD domain-containing putative transcriptional regulator n=1 Tax=Thermobifida halotolerans TaxID=483545 RepID=UPI003511343B